MDWITFTKEEVEADSLPPFCVECGAPATSSVSKTFDYLPEWVGWLFLAGILPGVIASMILQKQMRVSCPLCDRHREQWRIFPFSLRLGWLIIPLGAGIGYPVSLLPAAGDEHGLGVLIGGLVAAVAWGIWVGVDYVHRDHVKATRITADEIAFEGMADSFVKAARERQQTLKSRPPG